MYKSLEKNVADLPEGTTHLGRNPTYPVPGLYLNRARCDWFPIYSKPSLIRLQLIRMSDNQDRNMKTSVHSWVCIWNVHMEFRSKSD
jgi:hypothetical protein